MPHHTQIVSATPVFRSVTHTAIICWIPGMFKLFTFNLWLLFRTYIFLRPLSYPSLARTGPSQPDFRCDSDICNRHLFRNFPRGTFRQYAPPEPIHCCMPIASICASRRSRHQRVDGHGRFLRLRCGSWRAAGR